MLIFAASPFFKATKRQLKDDKRTQLNLSGVMSIECHKKANAAAITIYSCHSSLYPASRGGDSQLLDILKSPSTANCSSAIHLCVFSQLYELIAYKLKACWRAHEDPLYLYFVSNKYLFKTKQSLPCGDARANAYWDWRCPEEWRWNPRSEWRCSSSASAWMLSSWGTCVPQHPAVKQRRRGNESILLL